MLNKTDIYRVLAILDVINHDIKEGVQYTEKINTQTILWLAETLKEKNNELSQVHLELQKANEENARIMEVYGP